MQCNVMYSYAMQCNVMQCNVMQCNATECITLSHKTYVATTSQNLRRRVPKICVWAPVDLEYLLTRAKWSNEWGYHWIPHEKGYLMT